MNVLEKTTDESILYSIDMAGIGSLSGSDTISAVTSAVADQAGLTISNIAHNSASIAQFRASGGTLGTLYHIKVIVTTTGGDTLEGGANLQIISWSN